MADDAQVPRSWFPWFTLYTFGQKFSDFFLHVSNLQISLLGLRQKWHIVMLLVVCNLKFEYETVMLFRQILRHYAFKHMWIINIIQGGMWQLVMMLEKVIWYMKVVCLWINGVWYWGGSEALCAHFASHEWFSFGMSVLQRVQYGRMPLSVYHTALERNKTQSTPWNDGMERIAVWSFEP